MNNAYISMTKLNHELLRLLNLKPRDLRIYEALLGDDGGSIRSISENSGINRGTTYESIKKLSDLGLVTHIRRGKRKLYKSNSPDSLLDLRKETMKTLDAETKDLENYIRDLKSLKGGEIAEENLTKMFEGYEGVAVVLKDVLSVTSKLPEKEYYVYSSKALRGHLYIDFPRFKQRRVKLGIKVKVIAVGAGGDELELAERKWIKTHETRHLASYTIIYGNKVATISLSDAQVPYAVVIEDTGVSAMQKLVFDKLWEQI